MFQMWAIGVERNVRRLCLAEVEDRDGGLKSGLEQCARRGKESGV